MVLKTNSLTFHETADQRSHCQLATAAGPCGMCSDLGFEVGSREQDECKGQGRALALSRTVLTAFVSWHCVFAVRTQSIELAFCTTDGLLSKNVLHVMGWYIFRQSVTVILPTHEQKIFENHLRSGSTRTMTGRFYVNSKKLYFSSFFHVFYQFLFDLRFQEKGRPWPIGHNSGRSASATSFHAAIHHSSSL